MNRRTPEKPRFVAGSIGPTNQQLSIAGNVNDPGYRAVTFDQMVATYYEQVAALVEGGVDILLAETAFDTLVLKACLFAIDKFFASGSDATSESRASRAGDGLVHDLRRRPHALGPDGRGLLELDLARRPAERRHQLRAGPGRCCGPTSKSCRGSRRSIVSCYPNAGLPNAFGGFDETPEMMARTLGEFAAQRLAEHRRRLLRHDAGAHPGDRRGRRRQAAAHACAARAAHALQRPGAADAPPRQQFHHDRRADQRHRLEDSSPG